MIKDHLFIFFPWVDWDSPWQRYQHLALRFSETNRVGYMNCGLAVTYLIRNPLLLMKKWFQFLIGKRRISSNLIIYFPPPFLPFQLRNTWINCVNQYILFLYIKLFVKPKGPLILWISNPYNYLMIKLLKPRISVYDCPDAIVFKDDGKRQKIYDQLKVKILRESTISFFTSNVLLEEGRKYSKNCFNVPNGVDIQSFIQSGYRIPKEIGNLSGTILGVVGTFDDRIDLDLIDFILENIRDATLLFVGPLQVKMGSLIKHPRVVLTGKRAYEEIPGFIRRFDVGLIPYRINDVTKAVYPVKLHEYLMLGKPVVSTNLPEVEEFSEVVWIANSKEEFVSSIRKALQMNNRIIEKKRIATAKNNSWEKRVNQIERIIDKYY